MTPANVLNVILWVGLVLILPFAVVASHSLGMGGSLEKEQVVHALHTHSARELAKPHTLPGETVPIPVCCMCGLVREATGASLEQERWVTKRTYRKTHGVNLVESYLTHTYCPEYFTDFLDRVRSSGRLMGMTL